MFIGSLQSIIIIHNNRKKIILLLTEIIHWKIHISVLKSFSPTARSFLFVYFYFYIETVQDGIFFCSMKLTHTHIQKSVVHFIFLPIFLLLLGLGLKRILFEITSSCLYLRLRKKMSTK